MRILAIETSCDETALAIVEASGTIKAPRFSVVKNLVSSQVKIHRPFGGVVPSLAKREHLRNLPILFNKLFGKSISDQQKNFQASFNIDLITVTIGPGLEPALWTGINFAKDIYKVIKKTNKDLKIIAANHLEGHLFSFLLKVDLERRDKEKIFPAIALIISGGHTILLLVKDLARYHKLGETRDDAVGEAFDKVARLLELPYPGGPEIERIAKNGNARAIFFPRPMLQHKNYDFSFSGLKTAVLYFLREKKANKERVNKKLKVDIAASFEEAAFEPLIYKTLKAVEEFKARSILVSGGVAANKTLRLMFTEKLNRKNQEWRKQGFACRLLFTDFPTDNAAMIAVAGYLNFLRQKKGRLIANGNLNIC